MAQVSCGLTKSTNRPDTRVPEPNSIIGSAFISKAILAVEPIVETSWCNNEALSCASATPDRTILAANNAKMLLIAFINTTSACFHLGQVGQCNKNQIF